MDFAFVTSAPLTPKIDFCHEDIRRLRSRSTILLELLVHGFVFIWIHPFRSSDFCFASIQSSPHAFLLSTACVVVPIKD